MPPLSGLHAQLHDTDQQVFDGLHGYVDAVVSYGQVTAVVVIGEQTADVAQRLQQPHLPISLDKNTFDGAARKALWHSLNQLS